MMGTWEYASAKSNHWGAMCMLSAPLVCTFT